MTLETIVGAVLLLISNLPTGEPALVPVAGPVSMKLSEYLEQSVDINKDQSLPYLMVCLPPVAAVEANTQ